MKILPFVAWMAVMLAAVAPLSCAGGGGPAKLPVTVAQYEALSTIDDANTFPAHVVRMYNVQRALDNDLPTPARLESLHVAVKLGGEDPAVLDRIASVLTDPRAAPEMQKIVLEYLLRVDRPGLASHAVKALSNVKAGSPLRSAVLGWLAKNGDKSMLADVVRAWAQERINGEDETSFRRVVEKIARVDWERALLDGINTESFFARGSAMEILAGRVAAAALIKKVAAMTPKTEAMAALKASIIDLDYLPADGMALLTTVTIYRSRPDVFKEAAHLARQWQDGHAYSFNIRDFYLLSRLSGDPMRPSLRRDDLVSNLNAALSRRVHVPRADAGQGSDQFAKQVANLTMADLWNLYLLNQMLLRPQVARSIGVMAGLDRADVTAAWGGLVVYESGQAEATIYPSDKDAVSSDVKYMPSRKLMTQSREALCRFTGHFEKASNAARAAPTADELADARSGNYYGLTLTSVSDTEFCAHYYNPQGAVVSLGRFPFVK